MALSAYLSVKGVKQGQFHGSVTAKGHEQSILVIAAGHSVSSPRDAASGLPTGKRMHKPFVIKKQVDASSPQLYQALVTNETLNAWRLDFFRPAQRGPVPLPAAEELFYTVTLTNASIASIDFAMTDSTDPSAAQLPDYEDVAFTYQRIEWTITAGGITATDDWQTA